MEEKIRQEGLKLLEKHEKLKNQLSEIPRKRKMKFRIEERGDRKIAKPRFDPPKFTWPPKLKRKLLEHLQEIWDYLQHYSYYFDKEILSFIHKDNRRSSKHSIPYLLKNDVWATDEVYGDYLLEKEEISTTISYFRRSEKRKSFTIETIEDQIIEEWIIQDARSQVIDAFNYKWDLLSTEIDTCANALHLRAPDEPLSNDQLISQIKVIEELIEYNMIAGVLSLGRISEIWCLHKLGQSEKEWQQNYIQDLKKINIISNSEGRLLNNIRIIYNSIKHKTNFQVQKTDILDLYNQFCHIVGLKK